jgi:Ni,Fe-hydrogenase III small subunit/Pyruvate/2-oxoacid:ferredoxin oxidoreductase delta subunit
MLRVALTRMQQEHRTIAYPAQPSTLPEHFRGLPLIDRAKCRDGCRECADVCPTRAIDVESGGLRLDLGRCLFCTECMEVCPTGSIQFTSEHRLAASWRDDLVVGSQVFQRAKALAEKSQRLFGRSLKLRQVSAAGCSACEADLNVLGTVVFDLGRFGIQFVASPRHADGIVVTGPVSENMRMALLDTYNAMPSPRLVIAVGACAISGGPYLDNPEVHNGCDGLLNVDLFIPGCPPHPVTILDGLLRLLGQIE